MTYDDCGSPPLFGLLRDVTQVGNVPVKGKQWTLKPIRRVRQKVGELLDHLPLHFLGQAALSAGDGECFGPFRFERAEQPCPNIMPYGLISMTNQRKHLRSIIWGCETRERDRARVVRVCQLCRASPRGGRKAHAGDLSFLFHPGQWTEIQ